MNTKTTFYSFIVILCTIFTGYGKDVVYENESESQHVSDFSWHFSGLFKPEMFYGKNISLLNNCNSSDRIWYMKHVADITADLEYGEKTYGEPVATVKGTVRDKSIWGNPASIASTTEVETKTLDEVGRRHSHNLPRNFFWIRELWLRFSLTEALGISFGDDHAFTIGMFPFKLGRGIALGDAYAVGPEQLGFYSDSIVDQYAYGAKVSGNLFNNNLGYDLYAAILQNKSDNLSVTGQRTYGQLVGRIEDSERGFGVINYAVAGRLNWHVCNNSLGENGLTIEPYWLYNRAPEQRISFRGDAQSKLGTIGMSGEYIGDTFSFGFDSACNMGHQNVHAIDRNTIILANKSGCVAEVNSHIRMDSSDGDRVPYIPDSEAQELINSLRKAEKINEDKEDDNGAYIGEAKVSPCCCESPKNKNLYNASDRYRNSYRTKYQGWMFIADAAAWLYKKELQLAGTFGVASGDENPNINTRDGDYKGFIGLQEVYSGKRVRSAFVLGSAGKLKRPLSVPRSSQSPNRFATNVSRFTNLVFCGSGLTWQTAFSSKPFKINPNILAYWQDYATNKFDAKTGKELEDSLASRYLGLEANLFVDYDLLDNLSCYFVGSVYFPGQHYKDIQGKPLNDLQVARLEKYDTTGFTGEHVPNIGHDVAYTFNAGLKFTF